jgi:hypothetical protein
MCLFVSLWLGYVGFGMLVLFILLIKEFLKVFVPVPGFFFYPFRLQILLLT